MTVRALQILKGIHHLKVLTDVPTDFLAETLHRPWMRLKIFYDEGPLARTPECFKKFYYDWKVVTPSPVHYISEPGNWIKKEDGRVNLKQNHPIPLIYPDEIHRGIWGGEAVIKGFEKRHEKRRRVAKYWVPPFKRSVVYSEILDKYMNIMVTERALRLIDDHYGLDSYLLKTTSADLMSQLALRLKKEMIYTLIEKSLYPDDPVKREEIYHKYKEHIMSEDELEWFALNLSEAYRKQVKIEEKEKNPGPYKHIFRKEFVQHLRENPQVLQQEKINSEKTILERLNLFGKK